MDFLWFLKYVYQRICNNERKEVDIIQIENEISKKFSFPIKSDNFLEKEFEISKVNLPKNEMSFREKTSSYNYRFSKVECEIERKVNHHVQNKGE